MNYLKYILKTSPEDPKALYGQIYLEIKLMRSDDKGEKFLIN